MTLPPKLKKFLDNWPVKLLALVAAIFLYAFYQVTNLKSETFAIPLTVVSNGEFISVEEVPKNIRVQITGLQKDISQLDSRDFSASIDLSYYTSPGNYSASVNLQPSADVVAIEPLQVKVKPQNIPVKLEQRVVKYVNVSPVLIGETNEDFEVKSVSVIPSVVPVLGPKSILSTIKEIQTNPVSIEDMTSSLTTEQTLYNRNKMITVDYDEKVSVSIDIAPILMEKTYESVPLSVLFPTDGLDVVLPIEFVTVVLSGNQKELKEYEIPFASVYVDCSTITEPGVYTLPIQTYLLRNFTVNAIIPKEISVEITENSILSDTIDDIIEEIQ